MKDQGVTEVFKRLSRANLEKILTERNLSKKQIQDVVLIDEKKKKKSFFPKCRIFS